MQHGEHSADGFRRKAGVMDEREMRLTDLKRRVASGEYRVEPYAVADAIIRRLCDSTDEQAAEDPVQNECSNPVSGTSVPPSRKITSGGPSRTRPTKVRPEGRLGIVPVAPAGMHAQSS